jgi:Ca-activated chloride channel family protein
MAAVMPRPLALLGAAIVTMPIGVAPSPQQQPTFRATAEVVLVDALVTRNVPVDGLKADDFDVRDSGVRQTVIEVMLGSLPVDLLIVLDVSGSLDGDRLDRLKRAVRAAVAALPATDRVMLLDFSDDVRLTSDWTTDRSRIERAVETLQPAGWTSLLDAAFTALVRPEVPGRRQLMLLVTDGRDTASWLSAADVLKVAERSSAIVYGVSAGATARVKTSNRTLRDQLLADPGGFRALFLPVLVGDTGGELLDATFGDLSDTFVSVINRFSRRYVLTYTPSGVSRQGWHPIEVRMRDSGLTVTARRGYTR